MGKTSKIFSALVFLSFLTGCAKEDVTITDDIVGTWARIVDHQGREVVHHLNWGGIATVPLEGVLISTDNGGTTNNQIFATAFVYRQSDNCPLGSATYEDFVGSNNLTGTRANDWHITYVYSGIQSIGPNGECLR